MGLLGDMGGFEAFQLKDWWNKARKNPEQLLIGAGDPLSAKMWSGITGKKYEPFVDQMGGPYGGHMFSVGGNTDGGVYGRAREAGIDTDPSRDSHNVAHAIAAIFAGNYGYNAAGGLMGGGSSAAPSSASTPAASSPASGFDWQSMLKQQNPQGLLGGGQQGQQQPQPMMPPQQDRSGMLIAQLMRSKRAQALRAKLNRTPQEDQELRELGGSL